MGEPHILTTLRRKREEIERVIAFHLDRAEAAGFDLAAVDRSIALFEPRKQTAFPLISSWGACGNAGRLVSFVWRL